MGSLTKLLPECLGLLLVIPILISLAYLWPQVARNRSRTALSLALVALLGMIHQAMFRTRAEDAFITFRYALNLATGKGVVFNPGEHVEGYSNFLFLVVLAGLKRYFDIDIELAARALGVAASSVTVLLTYHLARKLMRGDGHAGLLAALLVASSGSFAAWGPSGMETAIFILLGVLIVLGVVSERWLWTGLLTGLATMTRPDGVLFILLVALYAALVQDSMRQRLKTCLLVVGPFFALILPWTAWRIHYYGYLVPNALQAKRGMEPLYQIKLGVIYLATFAMANAPVLWLAGILFSSVPGKRTSRRVVSYPKAVLSLGVFLLAFVLYVVLVGGDWMPAWRFFAPIVPLAAVLLVTLWSVEAPEGTLATGEMPCIKSFAIASGLLFVMSFLCNGLIPGVKAWRGSADGLAEIGDWFHRTLPPDTLVAAFPNGALSYRSQLPIVDVLGLTDEHIARFGKRLGKGDPGHIAYDYAYVVARRPAIIALLDGQGLRPEPEGLDAIVGYLRGRGLEVGDSPGPDQLKSCYEALSFRFPASKNSLGQYVNLLVLRSERQRIAGFLANDPGVRPVPVGP